MTPDLTDRTRLQNFRKRAQGSLVTFLHEAVLGEIQERLSLVNKAFKSPALVAPYLDFWAPHFSDAKVIGDEPILDLEEGAHDLVIHAMALHWADDPVGQLIQCRRALTPDGLFLAVAPGGRTLHELRAVLAETETRLRSGLSPRVLPMADVRELGGLLQRAGFALPVTDTIMLDVTYASARHLMRDLRGMGESNALSGRDPRPLNRGFMEAVDQLYAERFATRDGRISATFELVCLTGWAPSGNQPKALRPGSARQRLADALETKEFPAGGKAGREDN